MKKVLLFVLFFFLFSGKALASDKFSTSYSVTYNVTEKGSTHVTSNVGLTNNTSDYYVSKYIIKTGFKDISAVSVRDEGGNISAKVDKNDSGTQISFNFNVNSVGIGKTKRFTVSYDTPEIAKSSGDIWEVNIPGFSGQEEYQSFSAVVKVPDSFGKASIVKPATTESKVGQKELTFSKKDLGRSGISIYFGDSQIYSFDLSYHLSNKNILPQNGEIALPSNNNYQDIYISDITPKPSDVYMDKDGNWLAQFKLSPNSKKNVRVSGKAKIHYSPGKENISEDEIKLFTKPQKYWEADNPKIQSLARELKTPEAIQNYVVSTLKYDSTRVKNNQDRAGAAGVLANPSSAVCLEFTDLFIALSRAAGIPAREVEGFANTSNSASRPLSLEKDVLHAWPEYYDFTAKEWRMVDPTWQNTTGGTDYFNVFDFDHFGFVINGENSSYPVPAGGYKLPGQDSQDVVVVPDRTFIDASPQLLASVDIPKNQTSGLRSKGKISVSNNSGLVSPSQQIELTSSHFEPKTQSLYIGQIPPFGKREINFAFNPRPVLTKDTDEVKIMIGKNVIVAGISVSPFFINPYFYAIGGVLIGIIAFIIFKIARRSRSLPVS